MMYKMRLIEDEFDNIKYHNKIVEVRLNDEKRRNIHKGDKIVFYKLPHTTESIQVSVEQTFIFSKFIDVYNNFPSSYFGYKDIDIEEIVRKIYKIYNKEQEKSIGVMAIKFNVEK